MVSDKFKRFQCATDRFFLFFLGRICEENLLQSETLNYEMNTEKVLLFFKNCCTWKEMFAFKIFREAIFLIKMDL